MSWRLKLRPFVQKQISSWALPDFLLVEVYLRLREELAEDPQTYLTRRKMPFDGLVYLFSVVDPDNRLCEHTFFFHVKYGKDEESIEIVKGGYRKDTGI